MTSQLGSSSIGTNTIGRSGRGSLAAAVAAALLGGLVAVSADIGAQTGAETMLGNAAVNDLEALRRYLFVKANDLQALQIGYNAKIAALEARIAELEREASTDSTTAAVFTAPFMVVDAQRQVILEVTGSAAAGADLKLGDAKGATVQLSTAASVGAISVAAKGQVETRLTSSRERTGLELNQGETTVAFVGRQAVPIGDGVDQDVSVVALNNDAGETVAALSAEDDGGHIGLYDSTGANEGAELSAGAAGGTLKIANASGTAVAGILATPNGGRMLVTGAEGGRTVAALYAQAGGQLRLWDPAGSTRVLADSNSDGHSQLSVLSGFGSVTLDAADTLSPMLEIADGSGAQLVRAGINTEGVGVVATGPNGWGPAGIMGGGTLPASQIAGSKVGK